MRSQVSALLAACYNAGCAPPPVGKGGSSQSGPASRSARIRSVQSRGRAIQAMKSGTKGAKRQLAAARERVAATATKPPKGRYVMPPMDAARTDRLRRAGIPYGAEGRKVGPRKDRTKTLPSGTRVVPYSKSYIGKDGKIQHVVEEAGMATERPRGKGTKAGLFGR